MIAGDDYHRWERGDQNWKVYSHLDVRANDLHQQMEHAIAISNGRSVLKGTYDHVTGRFTEKKFLDPKDIVIFQGLHTLTLTGLRTLFDLKIFLDPAEDLRRFWKVQRDQRERGYTANQVLESMALRDRDRQRYILPQREVADLILSWQPEEPLSPTHLGPDPILALNAIASNDFNLADLILALAPLPALQITHDPFVDVSWQQISVRGTAKADDLGLVARRIIPNLEEISFRPEFQDDLTGFVQLLFLYCPGIKLQWGERGNVPKHSPPPTLRALPTPP